VPSSEIMDRFEHGKLHSGKKVKGKKRKIVKNKKQAKAILLSYLRKEGRIGPRKKGKGKNHSKKRVAGKK
jgi:integrase